MGYAGYEEQRLGNLKKLCRFHSSFVNRLCRCSMTRNSPVYLPHV